jgi:hypothetical protein
MIVNDDRKMMLSQNKISFLYIKMFYLIDHNRNISKERQSLRIKDLKIGDNIQTI